MTPAPPLDRSRLRPGMRVAVAVSGGADSVALLRGLVDAALEIGLVLSVAHVHHGIRGADADADAEFVQALAERLGLPFLRHDVDTPSTARSSRQTLEEAARTLRYAWFRELLAEGRADSVATAHTLDDQAETVLHRLLRGAWTEGLGSIHPVIACASAQRASSPDTAERAFILRPFLQARRADIEAWLRSIGQPWREDATNVDIAFTRNRIRHELLPQLAAFNPRIADQLAHMAEIARDEEAWWDAELARLLPGLLLPGKPVRGGGRAVSTHPDEGSMGIELERLRALSLAVRRRVLRAAAQQLGCGLNFDETERLMAMVAPDAPRKQQFAENLRVERTARELRLIREAAPSEKSSTPEAFLLPIPGEVTGLGVTLRATLRDQPGDAFMQGIIEPIPPAILRTPCPGDRALIQYSRRPKPLKEVFERMGIDADARKTWPVVEWQRRIVWMKGLVVEAAGIPFLVEAVG